MNFKSLFLQSAPASEVAGESNYSFIIMMALIFVVMYFLMIRPQQKRQKELTKFRNSLEKGSKVITAGGIYATVKQIDQNSNVITIEVDNNVSFKIDKSMLMRDTADMVRK